jgi:hypothetical protein
MDTAMASRACTRCAPHRGVDAFPASFRREINADNLMLATGESRAHLNDLAARGALEVSVDEQDVLRFMLADELDMTHS